MIIPTCQVCGTTLDLEDGNSAIETVIRRGAQDDDPDIEQFWSWAQELRFRFCGEEHMKSWLNGYALPAYEQPEERKTPPFEVLANAVLVTILAVVVSGAVYGFFLLLGEIF